MREVRTGQDRTLPSPRHPDLGEPVRLPFCFDAPTTPRSVEAGPQSNGRPGIDRALQRRARAAHEVIRADPYLDRLDRLELLSLVVWPSPALAAI
jgi:hypothetical protein